MKNADQKEDSWFVECHFCRRSVSFGVPFSGRCWLLLTTITVESIIYSSTSRIIAKVPNFTILCYIMIIIITYEYWRSNDRIVVAGAHPIHIGQEATLVDFGVGVVVKVLWLLLLYLFVHTNFVFIWQIGIVVTSWLCNVLGRAILIGDTCMAVYLWRYRGWYICGMLDNSL